jgi:large subunit ribosomal protein L21
MKYAVIAIAGSQYQVKEDQIISVNTLSAEVDSKNKITEVLLINDDGKVTVGTPHVKDASVEYTVVKNYQDKKIRVSKFKAKSRYRKTMGFRAQLTDIKITKISA